MLHYRHPDHLQMGPYLEQFSQHKRAHAYTIGEQPRFGTKKHWSASASVGPGQYRVDRDWPLNDRDECGSNSRAGCIPTPKYTFTTDDRVHPGDGSLKGISPFEGKTPNLLGPGQYSVSQMGSRTNKSAEPRYSIPSCKETAEALRERKRRGFAPGPGTYESTGALEEGELGALARDRAKALERLAKKTGKKCWAADQYSSVFARLKPAPKCKALKGVVHRSASTGAVTGSMQA